MRIALVCLLSLAFTTHLPAWQDSTVHRDVVHGKVGEKELKLDVFQPAGKGPFPLVVMIHGGGWAGGSYKDLQALGQRLAKLGYVAASVQYRLVDVAPFPAAVEDVKCAVRFLKANASKYQIDTTKVGATGFSAGGHLSLMLGVTTSKDNLEGAGDLNPEQAKQASTVDSVVNIFGPTDLATGDWQPNVTPLVERFIGGKIAAKQEAAKKASPFFFLDGRKVPPILTIHGTKDDIVPFSHATKFHEALKKQKSVEKLIPYEGLGHGWGGEKLEETIKEMDAFFRENLKVGK